MVVRSRTAKSSKKAGAAQPQRFNDAGASWNYTGQHTFGSYLKGERARRGCSRHMLATLTGIPDKRLEGIEMGKETASFRDIRAISTALEIPEADLMAAGHV